MPVEALGIAQLEKLLCPLPDRSAVLFAHDPGVEAEPFLYHATQHRLAQGGRVVYALSNRAPGSVLASMAALGLDLHEHRDRLHFVDAFSPAMGLEAPGATPAPDLNALLAALERLADEHPDAWLMLDSLSSLLDQAGEESFSAAFPRLRAATRRFGFTAALFTRWPYGAAVQPVVESFDAQVGVHAVVDRVMTGQYFVVERLPSRAPAPPRPRLFKTLKPGGVHVYVPKILVTGPYNAGKSSLLHAMSDTAVSVDHLGTTVALDHGRATMEGLTADLFGTPGQTRFDPILRILAGQAVGVIVVVDSTKPESFPRAKEMLQQTWRQGLPGIIAANKQDLPHALTPAEVERMMDPPPRVKVVGCSAEEPASAKRLLKELLDQILAAEVPA